MSNPTMPASGSSRADKYMIAEQVGKGSFGAANVVINKETKKKYVLKRIRLARLSDWQRRSSFQELQLVSSLDHPFVVPFVEGWVDRGHTINIVYGYCRNGDLGSLLHAHKGHFSEDRLKMWLAQALLGLEYIHKAGVLHRDIKSSNLFLTRDYDIQIGDFGLATIRDGKSADPDYSRYGFGTDIWSLGCVMYELTALKPAFNAFNMHGLMHKIRKASLAPLPSQYSPEWRTIIKTMLKKAANKRPTVSDLINAPCMRDAVLKACKRAKQINQHFCYTDLSEDIPSYWNPQLELCPAAQSFGSSSGDREAQEGDEEEDEEEERRVQVPLRSDDTSCQASDDRDDDEPPPRQESQTPSASEKTVTEESECDQPLTSHPEPNDEEKFEELLPEPPRDDSQETTPLTTESVDAEEAQRRERGNDSVEGTEEKDISESTRMPCPADASAFCTERVASPVEDREQETRIQAERDPGPSKAGGGLMPYKVDRVDVRQLDKEAAAAEPFYASSNHWCNPSHMSAFLDSRRGDALEAIPEGSCEEGDTMMWQSLPVPNEVYSIPSPRRENFQDQSLSSHPDPQATHSFWGESPSQLDPRLSSVISGSLCVDGQKRLDTVEQVLSLCSSLYSRGRWHELGHVLNQAAKQCHTQGFEPPEHLPTRLNLFPGDRVVVGSTKSANAIVRYYGPVAFANGEWVGLELENPSGNTDGTANGISYFSCPKDYGLFVKASMFDKNEN